jgi:hypothetical protein
VSAAGPVERCHRCEELRGDVRPVHIVTVDSCPGFTVRECRACTPHCPLDDELPATGVPR